MEPSGNNMVIAYAAKGGTVASDGTGLNSPYTEALLAHLEKPGLEVGKLFRKVTASVKISTKERQEPVTYASFPEGDIYLAGQPAPVEPPSPIPPNPDPGLQADNSFSEEIKKSEDPSDFEEYLKQFPDGKFVLFADRKLSHLNEIATRGKTIRDKHGNEAMYHAAQDNDIDVLRWLNPDYSRRIEESH